MAAEPVRPEGPLRRVLLLGVGGGMLLIAAGLALTLGAGAAGQYARPLLLGGVAVLVSTPVLRELVLGVVFARRREWRFAGVCAGLLAVIALSVFLGAG